MKEGQSNNSSRNNILWLGKSNNREGSEPKKNQEKGHMTPTKLSRFKGSAASKLNSQDFMPSILKDDQAMQNILKPFIPKYREKADRIIAAIDRTDIKSIDGGVKPQNNNHKVAPRSTFSENNISKYNNKLREASDLKQPKSNLDEVSLNHSNNQLQKRMHQHHESFNLSKKVFTPLEELIAEGSKKTKAENRKTLGKNKNALSSITLGIGSKLKSFSRDKQVDGTKNSNILIERVFNSNSNKVASAQVNTNGLIRCNNKTIFEDPSKANPDRIAEIQSVTSVKENSSLSNNKNLQKSKKSIFSILTCNLCK